MADYATTAGATMQWIRSINGNQPGDPNRAAEAILKVTETSKPPFRLLLGQDAVDAAYEKLELLKNDFDAWKATSLDVTFR